MPDKKRPHATAAKGAIARALKITWIYFTAGALWIILTEFAVVQQVGSFTQVSQINVIKGLLYVFLTACLLFVLLYHSFRTLVLINWKLKRSETSLLDAQKLAQIGSFEYNTESGVLTCTDELLRILGVPKESFSGTVATAIQNLRVGEEPELENLYQSMVRQQKPVERMLHIRIAGREERAVCVRMGRSNDETGAQRWLTGTVQDITERMRTEAALKTERDRAEMYLQTAAILFVVVNREGVVTQINRAGCELLGLPQESVLGKVWVEAFVPETCRADTALLMQHMAQGNLEGWETHESKIQESHGTIRHIVWRNALLFAEDGVTVTGMLSSGVDITELNAAQNALRESERSKSVLLSNLPGMAFRCLPDRDRTMQFISEGCYALTGYKPEDLMQEKRFQFTQIICPEHREAVRQEIERTIAQKVPFQYEYEIITANGERKWAHETNRAVMDENGNALAIEGIIIDVTESKRQFRQIRYMNDHDALTGLYNRAYFESAKLMMDTPDKLPLTLMLADINGLKLINDAFGLVSGDRMVRGAGELLSGCCRVGDVLARTGGDEFVILAPNTDHTQADALLSSIRKALEDYNSRLTDKALHINLSIVYSIKENESESLEEIARQMEDSLSRQKLLDKRSHHNATLATIMATMYERSYETEEHAERIALLSELIGRNMNLTQRQMDDLHLYSMLHDIGKIGISDQILKKPGPLDEKEWLEMRKHPEIGYRIAMSAPDLASVADCILTHHERWDGTGYPRGLRGEEIPLLSRILAVADAYDAMTENRIYRKGMEHSLAVEEVRKNAGTQFDPAIVKVFLDVILQQGIHI